jgi:hypothetical protein
MSYGSKIVAVAIGLAITGASIGTAAAQIAVSPRINVPAPRTNVPAPHMNMPTPHINVPAPQTSVRPPLLRPAPPAIWQAPRRNINVPAPRISGRNIFVQAPRISRRNINVPAPQTSVRPPLLRPAPPAIWQAPRRNINVPAQRGPSVNYAKRSKGPQPTPEERKGAGDIRSQVLDQEKKAARGNRGKGESGRSGSSGQAEINAGKKLVQIANAGRYGGSRLPQAVRNQLKTMGIQLQKKGRDDQHPGRSR